MSDVDDIRERDRQAECAEAPCHQAAADRRTLLAYIDERERQWLRSTRALVQEHEQDRGTFLNVGEGEYFGVVGPEQTMPVSASPVCPYCGMSTWINDHCALPGCEGFREVLQ